MIHHFSQVLKFIKNQKGIKLIIVIMNEGNMTEEKDTTIYLAIYGKILQIHLHGVIQIKGKITIGNETVALKVWI